tara:strand:+ start:8968 stop:10833 length:1866 start_codon:yes stop_codon:yes gene_type:complete
MTARLPISLYLKTTHKVDSNATVATSDYAKPSTLMSGVSEVNTTTGNTTTSVYEGLLTSNKDNVLFTKYFRSNSGYFYSESPSFLITSEKSSVYKITSSNDNFSTKKLGNIVGTKVTLNDTEGIKAGMVISTEDNSTIADTDYVRVVSVSNNRTLTISSSKTISADTDLIFKNKSSDGKLFLKYFTVTYNNDISTTAINRESIAFLHETQALPSTAKLIKSLSINKEDITYKGETRTFNVVGTPGAIFTLKITQTTGTDETYNFSNDTFTVASTTLANQTIDSTGIYTDTVVFPAITADDTYQFLITAGSDTSLDSNTFGSSPSDPTFTIYQYAKTTVTFTLESSANSSNYTNSGSNYGVSNVTQDGIRGQAGTVFNISWSLVATDARPFSKIDDLAAEDWRNATGTIQKTVNGATSSSTNVDVETAGHTTSLSTTDLVAGMRVSGTNISGSPTVSSITDANTFVISAAQTLSNHDVLTFDNGGTIVEFTKLNFLLGDETEKDETAALFTVDAATSDVNTVVLTAVGDSDIYDLKHHGTAARASKIVSGLRSGRDTRVTGINYSTRTVELSANQSFEAGQKLGFNTSQRVTITAVGKILQFGNKSINVRLELDNILDVAVS